MMITLKSDVNTSWKDARMRFEGVCGGEINFISAAEIFILLLLLIHSGLGYLAERATQEGATYWRLT
jgi:hypothetical protein